MTLIKNSELLQSNKSLTNTIESSRESLKKILEQLESFMKGAQGDLTGKGYSAIIAALDTFVLAINQQIKILDVLDTNLKSANNKMLNYIEGYTSLDTKHLEDLKQAYYKAERLYNFYREDINKYDGSSFTPRDLAKSNYYQNLMNDISRLIKLLEGLDTEDSAAAELLTDISNDIKKQNNAIALLNFESNKPINL